MPLIDDELKLLRSFLTEEDGGRAWFSAARVRVSGDATTLIKGDTLLEVVEICIHLITRGEYSVQPHAQKNRF